MKNVIINIDIKKIYPNPEQPRKTFENIEDLALTIKYNGLINPITVVKSDEDRYMIVSGERRYRACLLNQLKFIKCNIVDIDEFQLQEMTLIENIQRDDLTDFEKAKYIGLMWSTGRYEKKQDLAAALGKSQSYISKAFSCLKLDETILQDLENNSCDVPLSVLDEISKIKDKDNQKDVYSKYLNNEITRDEIRIIKPEKLENFARENLENTPGETKEKEVFTKNILVGFGFGTKNEIGSYISLVEGDITGVFKFDMGGDFIKTTHNKEYKITIEIVCLIILKLEST